MTRAVLDPNVIVAAAISPSGTPAACLRAHAGGRFEHVVSPKLLGELHAVFRRRKFRPYLTVEQGDQLVAALERGATVVEDPHAPERLSRDRGDDYLLALARATAAHVLVTGDQDLLAVDLRDVAVLTPREFLDRLPD